MLYNCHLCCFFPKTHHEGKGPHSDESTQTQILGNCGNSCLHPAVRGAVNEQRGRGMEWKNTGTISDLGHISSKPRSNCRDFAESEPLIVWALWLQWLTGSPLKIINGSQLL